MERRLPTKKFWAMLLVPVFVFLSMGAKPLYTVSVGDEIQLQTVPVDPRDPWYGEYVNLKFEIEEVAKPKITPDVSRQIMEGRLEVPVYVLLESRGRTYEISQVTGSRPNKGIYLEGTLFTYSAQAVEPDHYRIHYPGWEQFYVEEGKGSQLEQLSQSGNLVATLKVYKGYAILTKLEKTTP